MQYEWDENKCRANLLKHGIGFELVEAAEWEQALLLPDTRRDYGEERMLAYLPIHGRLHAVIYARRGDEIRRIISLRKANRREQDYVRNYPRG